MAWKAGRFLMRLDIALRRRGYGDEVEATIATLRNLAAKDETRDLVRCSRNIGRCWQPVRTLLAVRRTRRAALPENS
jgi:hypothetical protein